jgi:SAM-dependent methyltransferase
VQTDQFQLHAEIEERHWWFTARRRIMGSLVRAVLPPAPDTLVVDVGCGTGANLASLAGDYRCLGIDTSAEAIRLARQRYPLLEFRCGQAPADLGSLAARASLFLLMDVLEHVPDDFAMLSELLAAARPGALVLLTVPAHWGLWSQHDVSFGHFRRYDRARLEAVWQGLPVSTQLVSYYNSRLYPLVWLARSWNRRRGRAGGAAGTDFRLPAAPLNGLLSRVFAGERRRLLGLLAGRRGGYATGVSLMALLRRENGEMAIRRKPPQHADHDAPQAAWSCASA